MITKLIVLITAMGLVGCAVPPPAARAPAANTSPAAPVATPSPQPVKEAQGGLPIKGGSDALITFSKHGGLKGGDDVWTVNAGGAVQAGKSVKGTLAPDTLKKLVADIEAAGFFDLQDSYKNAKCNDCFEYVITVNNNGKTKSVSAIDDGHLPPTLLKVLETLSTAFESAR